MKKNLEKLQTFGLYLSILSLVIVAFAVILTSSTAFFSSQKNSTGQIVLGELDYSILISSSKNQNLVAGDNVDIDISIKNSVEEKTRLIPFYFRFKILNGEQNYDANFISLSNKNDYILGADFYYYKHKVGVDEEVNLINQIHIDELLSQQEAQELDLYIFVDAVQSEHNAYLEVFFDAPKEWLDFVENG